MKSKKNKKVEIEKHFVVFFSPGTFVAEQTEEAIKRWDVELAKKMADKVTERHGATPYGFIFLTRGRAKGQLDSEVIASSPVHYLGGEVFTLKEIESRHDPDDRVLITNMKCNKWKRVIENNNSYRWTMPFGDDDKIVDYIPPHKRGDDKS